MRALPELTARATRSYQPLAAGYQGLCKGGLVYQVTTVTSATRRYVVLAFFPDVVSLHCGKESAWK
jgi:hypothetical protein